MSDPSRCHHVTLAQSGLARVQSCTQCGCVSMHLGSTTLRFDAEGLEALWMVIGEAVAALHQRNEFGNAAALRPRGIA